NKANARIWGNTPPTTTIAEYAAWKGWWAEDSPRAGQPVAPEEWALARALDGEATEHIVSIEPFGAPGHRRTMLNSGAPVRDRAGNVIGAVIAQMDITERLKMAQELRERERRLRYTLDATRTVAWTYTLATGHIRRSETSLAILGLPIEGTIDEWYGIVHPDERDRFVADMARAIAGEIPYEFELRVVHPATGVERWMFVRGMLERDAAGEVVEVSGLATDVTERRLAEAQAQAAQRIEAIGRLAGGVAHEINNALSGVLGFASLALRRLAPEDPARGHVEQIARAGERAAAVTRQLLAFGRRQVLQTRDFDVCAVVDRFEPMMRQALGADKTLRILRCGTPAVVHADPGQIEQVLLNLALNARDAMAYGGTLEIAVSVEHLGPERPKELTGLRPGPWVCVRVTDDGTGMDDEVRAHLFEPFFTTKPVGQGSGLGLATVYGIVEQSNGHIAVTTARGAGTTFRVLLPEVTTPAAAVTPSAAAPVGLERR
ncbi:MAG: ATP-binding protein, partial [Myxococcota bacterium]